MKKITPQVGTVSVSFKERDYTIEYFYREGNQDTILFVHGLGGSKENYLEACKSDSLANHTLICFDNPSTGNSSYFEDCVLDVDDLAEITALFIDHMKINHFILCGTSVGGPTTLLYLSGRGRDKVKAYVSIEGNLMPEDCMFSSHVVTYDNDTFKNQIYPETISRMKRNGNTGYHIIANNLELNTNVRSYS